MTKKLATYKVSLARKNDPGRLRENWRSHRSLAAALSFARATLGNRWKLYSGAKVTHLPSGKAWTLPAPNKETE